MSTYETKKQQCKKRMIGFDFTEQEWISFNQLKYKVSCAYTNVTFSKDKDNGYYPTVERIDESKAYSVHNCVWVSTVANSLKNLYIELGKSTNGLSEHHMGWVNRIKRITSNVQNIQEIQKPYKHLFTNKQTKEGTNTMSGIDTKNKELNACYEYVMFGGGVENHLKQELTISFSQYKRLLNKKKCSLSGVEFSDTIKPALWVKDRACGVDVANVMVVSETLKDSLNKFTESANLNVEDLKKVCTILSKKL